MKERVQYEPCIYCGDKVEVTYEIPDDYPEHIMYFPHDHGLYMCSECQKRLLDPVWRIKNTQDKDDKVFDLTNEEDILELFSEYISNNLNKK